MFLHEIKWYSRFDYRQTCWNRRKMSLGTMPSESFRNCFMLDGALAHSLGFIELHNYISYNSHSISPSVPHSIDQYRIRPIDPPDYTVSGMSPYRYCTVPVELQPYPLICTPTGRHCFRTVAHHPIEWLQSLGTCYVWMDGWRGGSYCCRKQSDFAERNFAICYTLQRKDHHPYDSEH